MHKIMHKTGVLLVNLGTPDTAKPKDVRAYLTEFLTDGRVIDFSWFKRQLLSRGIIIPFRYKESAKSYARIWTEQGSPLKVYGQIISKKLQESLGSRYQVELAMRYRSPSIECSLNKLKLCEEIVIIPLFPQYASATTGSVNQKAMEILSRWEAIPKVHFVNSYPVQSQMIEAFCERGKEYPISDYDHVLFSFHGLPERQIHKVCRQDQCLKKSGCCEVLSEKNQSCYSAHCHATAQAIVKGLGLEKHRYSISYQSRLGSDPWLQPFTQDILLNLIKKNKKKVLVFSPAFVCDCLETTDEIKKEYKKEFLKNGGEALDLVCGLNDHPLWIDALKTLVMENISRTAT